MDAIAICRNLVDNEYTMRDANLRCSFCGKEVILTIPETQGQHAADCLIARAKAALAKLDAQRVSA